jgi:hypothetical protein
VLFARLDEKKIKRVGRKCLQGGGLLVYGKGTRLRMKNGLLKGMLFFFFFCFGFASFFLVPRSFLLPFFSLLIAQNSPLLIGDERRTLSIF